MEKIILYFSVFRRHSPAPNLCYRGTNFLPYARLTVPGTEGIRDFPEIFGPFVPKQEQELALDIASCTLKVWGMPLHNGILRLNSANPLSWHGLFR